MLGVGPQTVHKWETGKTPVDLDTLKLLARCYGTTPDALLFDPADGELVARLRRAHSVLTGLPAEKADQWLGVGEAMSPERPEDE
jgi:transcriptional regulator with XRE-family HTH domain